MFNVLEYPQIKQIVEVICERTKKFFVTKSEFTTTNNDMQQSLQNQINRLTQKCDDLDRRLKVYEEVTNVIDSPEENFNWDNYDPIYTEEEEGE